VLKPFDRYEFAPDQEVLLYAEVENFTSDEGPKGFRTSLEGSCRIVDSRGQLVSDLPLGKTDETCRNPRRDFFLGYHLRIPKRASPGKHTLQLSVVDLKANKNAEASLEFTVREPVRSSGR
jgi:hypothetical protein